METNKETLSRLKFLGKIQIGEKINLKYMYVQNDGLLTQISRNIFQDNRNKTLIFIQDTINKSFEILNCYENSVKLAERIMCDNIIEDLKNSKKGLINMKETYATDVKFCCDIDTLLQIIDARLTETTKLPPPPSS